MSAVEANHAKENGRLTELLEIMLRGRTLTTEEKEEGVRLANAVWEYEKEYRIALAIVGPVAYLIRGGVR